MTNTIGSQELRCVCLPVYMHQYVQYFKWTAMPSLPVIATSVKFYLICKPTANQFKMATKPLACI